MRSGPIFGVFQANILTIQNPFFNQDESLNDEGYDSKGNLPHFADKESDDFEGYIEPLIGVDDAPAPPAPAVAAELTVESVMRLGVKDLKDEPKKRGQATSGKSQSCRIA